MKRGLHKNNPKGGRIVAGEMCVLCGKQRGLTPAVLNYWHRCNGCKSIYCPDCGRKLPKAGFLGSRACPRCGNTTELF